MRQKNPATGAKLIPKRPRKGCAKTIKKSRSSVFISINRALTEFRETLNAPIATNARPVRSWSVFPFYYLLATIYLGSN